MKPAILFISLPIGSLFKLATMSYLLIFALTICHDLMSWASFKNCNTDVELIKIAVQ